KYMPGIRTPLSNAQGIDLMIVRENSEGEYSEVGGRFGKGQREFVSQDAIFTRFGINRITEYAVSIAQARSKSITSVTKSNGIIHSMTFWDEIVYEVAAN